MKELRIFGPPGTGKTTTLATREIPGAASKFGAERVGVASFTRAAAREIASRDLPVPEQNVGTLHSLCYKLLRNPAIAEGEKKYIERWNEKNGVEWPMKGSYKPDIDEGGAPEANSKYDKNDGAGDKALAKSGMYRNLLMPPREWPQSIQSFYTLWQEFKAEHDVVDFTDLIEKAVTERERPPHDFRVLFLDEAQDFTPLQLKLVRQWGNYMDWFVLCGDDDQTLYAWAGASPDAFLNPPVAANRKRVLSQSYRVSKNVHELAQAIIGRVGKREPKVYHPTDEVGEIFLDKATNYTRPDHVLRWIRRFLDDDGHKNVMVLGSCSYMLDPIKHALKKMGEPFHNPYRRHRGDWNPLQGARGKVSGRDVLTSFLGEGVDAPYWSVPQLVKWAKVLKVGPDGLKRDTGKKALAALKQAIKDKKSGLHTSREVLFHVLEQNALQHALGRDIPWLMDHVKSERKKGLEFPLNVYQNQGISGLTEEPRIILGTVHSVKGGEADSVILFPDVSYEAKKGALTEVGQDSIARVFYVGVTRARNAVLLTGPRTKDLHNGITQ